MTYFPNKIFSLTFAIILIEILARPFFYSNSVAFYVELDADSTALIYYCDSTVVSNSIGDGYTVLC